MRSSSEAAGFELQPDDVTATGGFVPAPLPGLVERPARFVDAGADAGPAPPEPAPDPQELRRAVFEEGREAGRADLPWREARQLETAIVALESAQRELATWRRDSLRAQRHALVELAIAIAEQILARELAADPASLVALLERALDALPPQADGEIALRLSPADHAALAEGEGEALARLARDGTLRIVADPRLAPGDARVEAGATTLDARRAQLLERVREALTPALDAGFAATAAAAHPDGTAEEPA